MSEVDEVYNELDQLIQTKGKIETVEEMDENTKAIYSNDLLYLFFKLLMFVFLGWIFYYLFKDQSPTEIVTQVKDKADIVSKVVRDKLSAKQNVKV